MKNITVESTVKAPMGKVWGYWNMPEHIVSWAFASNDWEAPHAENDLRVGDKFETTTAARDKSASFDFTGVYPTVERTERTRLSALLRLNSPIVKAYLLKEDLRRFWNHRSTCSSFDRPYSKR